MTLAEMEVQSLSIMSQCPRFLNYSVPICSLDLLQDQRTRLGGEPRCTLPKSRRQRIGKGTALERQGLTKREWYAQQRWESLSRAEKEERKANLSQFQFRTKRVSEQSTRSSDKRRVGKDYADKSTRIVSNGISE